MKLPFGYEISKTLPTLTPPAGSIPPNSGMSNWWQVIRESFSGAWQRNVDLRLPNVMTYSTVYACVTLIAQDIGKLCLDLYQKDENDIWTEVEVSAFSPVLRKPNHFQTRQKFIEHWVSSKLMHGNAYILKEREGRNVVRSLYVLDPQTTRPLISPNSEVFYQLATNYLAGINGVEGIIGIDMTELSQGALYVPASEIIHDTYCALYHPLCGVSPISACGLAAVQGLAMQANSIKFFNNGSQPGGTLIAPGPISEVNAKLLKEYWEQNFTGDNAGRIAVLGDGLKYEPLTVSASDAQLINQFKWTDRTICTAFKVPPYMVGVELIPSFSNIESINLQYYTTCLQPLMEAIEALLDDGLGLQSANQEYGTAFNLDDLLKMDTNTQIRSYGEGVSKGIFAPNEARKKIGYGPVTGGDAVFLQQQNFSVEALAKRDAKDDPFATKTSAPTNGAPPQPKPQPAPAQENQFVDAEFVALLKDAVNHASTH